MFTPARSLAGPFAVAVVVSLSGSPSRAPSLAAESAPAPAGPRSPLRVGVVTPLTGVYAGIGQQVRWGLELAAHEINADGGILGRPLELLFEDEEANPTVAVQKAERLLQ